MKIHRKIVELDAIDRGFVEMGRRFPRRQGLLRFCGLDADAF